MKMDEKIMIQDASEVDPNLLRMLNRGLEDLEAGRTLPHKVQNPSKNLFRNSVIVIGQRQFPG